MAKTIAIDFDGVLHSYRSGWTRADNVADPPTPGAQDYVRAIIASGYDIVVHSARATSPHGEVAIHNWLRQWGFPPLKVTASKPHALIYLDDRALRFDGTWPSLAALAQAERPWHAS